MSFDIITVLFGLLDSDLCLIFVGFGFVFVIWVIIVVIWVYVDVYFASVLIISLTKIWFVCCLDDIVILYVCVLSTSSVYCYVYVGLFWYGTLCYHKYNYNSPYIVLVSSYCLFVYMLYLIQLNFISLYTIRTIVIICVCFRFIYCTYMYLYII